MNPLGRHRAFFVGLACALIAYAAARLVLSDMAVVLAANAFFIGYLVLTAVKVPTLTADVLKKHAAGADEPAWAIFAITFGAVVLALASLFLAISRHEALSIGLALLSVALGWLTIHTMVALHCAYLYWRPQRGPGKGHRHRGGLEFPGTAEPNGFDFLYFAFVIGMTAQTSDVQITSTGMRRLNILHAVVSFFFNTVLLAVAVNLAVSLGG